MKFFPADIYGGLKAIKALAGPYFEMEFVPTGGIHQGNLQDYLAFEKILAVGGSFILSEALVAADGGVKAAATIKELRQLTKTN